MLRDGSSVGVDDGEVFGGGGGSSHELERCAKVHRTLKRIARARGVLDTQEAAALREAQACRLWRQHGYNSLLEYMEKELGYSPRAALERLRVAHAIVEVPEIGEAMEQGTLSFSGARELSRVATPETVGDWLEAAADTNLRQLEDLVSGRRRGDRPSDAPDPSLKKKILRFEVKPETYALFRQAQAMLEKERGERLDHDQVIAALSRLVIEGSASEERTKAPYQVAVTVCSQCKRGWQDGGGVTVEMSPPAVERAECDAEQIGSIDGEEAERAKQVIPPATRRLVLRRDHHRCRVPDCRSSRNLEIHHVVHREDGGTNEPSNLIALCEGHHIAHHDGRLHVEGTAPDLTFVRDPASSFKTATLVVETMAALKGLGYKKREARAAAEAARTHVGTADLPIQAWIKIALGKLPKPSSRTTG